MFNREHGFDGIEVALIRPADFRGWKAPEVLLNGNHEEIRRFRKESAIEKTARLRRDLMKEGPESGE